MTIHTLLLWSLTSVALCTSIFALSAVLRTSDRSLSRRLSVLSQQLKEHETTLDELSSQLKAMRQRESMRAYRDRRNGKSPEPDEPAETPDEWRRRMNRELALGKVKP